MFVHNLLLNWAYPVEGLVKYFTNGKKIVGKSYLKKYYYNIKNGSTEALSRHHLRSNNYQHYFISRPGVNISTGA